MELIIIEAGSEIECFNDFFLLLFMFKNNTLVTFFNERKIREIRDC